MALLGKDLQVASSSAITLASWFTSRTATGVPFPVDLRARTGRTGARHRRSRAAPVRRPQADVDLRVRVRLAALGTCPLDSGLTKRLDETHDPEHGIPLLATAATESSSLKPGWSACAAALRQARWPAGRRFACGPALGLSSQCPPLYSTDDQADGRAHLSSRPSQSTTGFSDGVRRTTTRKPQSQGGRSMSS